MTKIIKTYIQCIFLKDGVHDDGNQCVKEHSTLILPSRLIEVRFTSMSTTINSIIVIMKEKK